MMERAWTERCRLFQAAAELEELHTQLWVEAACLDSLPDQVREEGSDPWEALLSAQDTGRRIAELVKILDQFGTPRRIENAASAFWNEAIRRRYGLNAARRYDSAGNCIVAERDQFVV